MVSHISQTEIKVIFYRKAKNPNVRQKKKKKTKAKSKYVIPR